MRPKRFELLSSAWKADNLPLIYSRGHCGEDGIRTHDSEYTIDLANQRFQPLSHLSVIKIYVREIMDHEEKPCKIFGLIYGV
jgi:hypothetical protein